MGCFQSYMILSYTTVFSHLQLRFFLFQVSIRVYMFHRFQQPISLCVWYKLCFFFLKKKKKKKTFLFLLLEINYCAKEKFLLAREKNRFVNMVYQGKIFLTSDIISVGVYLLRKILVALHCICNGAIFFLSFLFVIA